MYGVDIMNLHNKLTNEECIGQKVCASIGKNLHWVKYSDGNNGEKDFYRDVFVDGHCAYMDGEVCEIRGYDEKAETITMYNESGEANADDYDGIFTIPYKIYLHDFGQDWMSSKREKRTFQVNISKPIYKHYTYEVEAFDEGDAMTVVSDLLVNGVITGNDLEFCTDEPDYDFKDAPDAFTIVDAIEITN